MNYYKERYRDERHLARYDPATIEHLGFAACPEHPEITRLSERRTPWRGRTLSPFRIAQFMRLVLRLAGMRQSGSNSHVAVVTGVHPVATGWTVSLMEQNASANGLNSISVSGGGTK
jgi:hypothetical protein